MCIIYVDYKRLSKQYGNQIHVPNSKYVDIPDNFYIT